MGLLNPGRHERGSRGRAVRGRQRSIGSPLQLALLCAVLLGAAGCNPNRVQGAVGDDEITIQTAMFSEHPNSFGDDGLLFVVLTEIPDACATYIYYNRELEKLTDPADQAALWSRVFPADFWEVVVPVRVADPTYPLAGIGLTGLKWDALLELRNHWFARFTHHTRHRDAGWYDGTGETHDYLHEYLSHQGTLELKIHDPGERVRGLAETLVVETDTERALGLVRVHFDAEYCHGVLGL